MTGSFWSAVNVDGLEGVLTPDDFRFVLSSGPFTMNPSDVQEIIFGIVWAIGADNIDSVAELRKADIVVQDAFDALEFAGSTPVYIKSIDAPSSFALHQNYPNPFNPATKISFDLSRDADVTLTVYNILGQEVAQLVNARLPAASHEVAWDASGLPSGLYHYKLVAGSFEETKSMLLLK